jgi:hypothetical protein
VIRKLDVSFARAGNGEDVIQAHDVAQSTGPAVNEYFTTKTLDATDDFGGAPQARGLFVGRRRRALDKSAAGKNDFGAALDHTQKKRQNQKNFVISIMFHNETF